MVAELPALVHIPVDSVKARPHFPKFPNVRAGLLAWRFRLGLVLALENLLRKGAALRIVSERTAVNLDIVPRDKHRGAAAPAVILWLLRVKPLVVEKVVLAFRR